MIDAQCVPRQWLPLPDPPPQSFYCQAQCYMAWGKSLGPLDQQCSFCPFPPCCPLSRFAGKAQQEEKETLALRVLLSNNQTAAGAFSHQPRAHHHTDCCEENKTCNHQTQCIWARNYQGRKKPPSLCLLKPSESSGTCEYTRSTGQYPFLLVLYQ